MSILAKIRGSTVAQIESRIAAAKTKRAELEAQLATATAHWETTAVDGTLDEKSAARKQMKAIAFEIEELDVERDVLERRLVTAREEEATAERERSWNECVKRWTAASKKTDAAGREYTERVEALIETLKKIKVLDQEARDLEAIAGEHGRLDELHELARRPGSLGVHPMLARHPSLERLPSLREPELATYYNIYEEEAEARRVADEAKSRELEARLEASNADARRQKEAADAAERERMTDSARRDREWAERYERNRQQRNSW